MLLWTWICSPTQEAAAPIFEVSSTIWIYMEIICMVYQFAYLIILVWSVSNSHGCSYSPVPCYFCLPDNNFLNLLNVVLFRRVCSFCLFCLEYLYLGFLTSIIQFHVWFYCSDSAKDCTPDSTGPTLVANVFTVGVQMKCYIYWIVHLPVMCAGGGCWMRCFEYM